MPRPAGVPGAPPPPTRTHAIARVGANSRELDDRGADAGELRIVQALARSTGAVDAATLHYASGMTASEFRAWLDSLVERGMVVVEDRGSEQFVTLQGKVAK